MTIAICLAHFEQENPANRRTDHNLLSILGLGPRKSHAFYKRPSLAARRRSWLLCRARTRTRSAALAKSHWARRAKVGVPPFLAMLLSW